MEQMHINFTHFKSEISLMNYFDTEDKCKPAIAQERWCDGGMSLLWLHPYLYDQGRSIYLQGVLKALLCHC